MSSDASTPPSSGEAPSDPSSGDRTTHQEDSQVEEEVSLLDLLVVLARNKTLIAQTILVFTLLGLTYAIFTPEEYTSSARVVRETQTDGDVSLPGGISSGVLSGLGINLGGGSSGLTPQAFPDVLQSREVKLAVVRDTFQFPDAEQSMTLVEYVSRPMGPVGTVLKYTVKLPWTLKRKLGDAISDPRAPAGTTAVGEPAMLSKEEDRALEAIEDMVLTSVDEETGLMTISVTAGGPHLASDVAQSFVEHLTTRVREIRTKKVRERLRFVKQRFQEVKRELEKAENRLAQFLERNQNPTTATLQFQRDRLQRQVTFKEQLYSDLQSQLTQTRIDLQRRQPVVTVVEEPAPPFQRSAPRRTVIVIVSLLFGGFLGVVLAFVRTFFERHKEVAEEREKIEEIREAFLPEELLDRIRGWIGSSTN